MRQHKTAYLGADIFDGYDRMNGRALLVQNGVVQAIMLAADIPPEAEIINLGGGLLAPGFVDLQVNGGGGIMFNTTPTETGIAKILATHLAFGTTSLLSTLISDTKARTTSAIKAAIKADLSGHIGLHLEGPHLSRARHGAHDPALIRPMEATDLTELADAAQALPTLFLTLAPESATPAQVRTLVAAGATISLGHSDAQPDMINPLIEAGAKAVTHLFNAMSPLQSRAQGLVGSALNEGRLFAGIIADGIHVDSAVLRLALRAKEGPGKIFLISDAMSSVGTDISEFTLNGRRITRKSGRLSLEDGTLAGADINMLSALRFTHQHLGVELEEALRMAALYPARLIGREGEIGCLTAGARADFIWLDAGQELLRVWQGGAQKH
ncbi:MAG: N-acetylglucosamine-6-phosphate deacetylase [Rhodobacteraceae bacterium]|nr:N-acetylglucosamine-6-phosphate deacetylase [Paracoccaceae bacterium]